ncbi:hypothetical protein QTP70_018554, partial [Hemibagrus guttatus]
MFLWGASPHNVASVSGVPPFLFRGGEFRAKGRSFEGFFPALAPPRFRWGASPHNVASVGGVAPVFVGGGEFRPGPRTRIFFCSFVHPESRSAHVPEGGVAPQCSFRGGRCPACHQRRRVLATPCSHPPAPWGVPDSSEMDIVAPEPSFVAGRRSVRVLGGGRRSALLLGGGRRLALLLGCGRHSALLLGCGRCSAVDIVRRLRSAVDVTLDPLTLPSGPLLPPLVSLLLLTPPMCLALILVPTTCLTPFQVVYGYQPPLFESQEKESSVPSAKAVVRQCHLAWAQAQLL